jgi:1-deoxy-D-xylulose-5-phosphate reductoisomerase
MTRLVLLGATGSIGTQTLDVAKRLNITPLALASGSGTPEFVATAHRYRDAMLAVANPIDMGGLRSEFGDRISFGPDAVMALAALPDTVVINGVVGFAGLDATLAALEAGNRLGLANKESMVTAGPFVREALQRGGGTLIPVDSEHSALFQCLEGEPRPAVRNLILTASGGPFRGKSRDMLSSVTPEEALQHPTWNMGARVTIDSATLANKGLEVIEAHYLFDVAYDQIQVVVHPTSIVHSLVEFVDGSLLAHMGEPDMRIPIQYAITYPDRAEGAGAFSIAGRTLAFEEPDTEVFRALALAYEAGRVGGPAPCVFNAADEVAVAAFLAGQIPFLAIPEVLERTLSKFDGRQVESVADVKEVDAEARALAADAVRVLSR